MAVKLSFQILYWLTLNPSMGISGYQTPYYSNLKFSHLRSKRFSTYHDVAFGSFSKMFVLFYRYVEVPISYKPFLTEIEHQKD